MNGVLELVADARGQNAEEVALAVRTAGELTMRLRLLRAAWGGVSDPMDAGALQAQMPGIPGSHRLQLDLDGLAPAAVFPPSMARLILNILLLAREAMPRGGVLALSGDPANHVVAHIAGPDAAWPEGFARCITEEGYAWSTLGDPRHLQAPLTALIAWTTGLRLSLMMATGPSDSTPPPLLITAAPN